MKTLIADLKTRLAQVPTIRYIDEDWGQLDYYSPNPPAKWPCALIDISQVQWTSQGQHIQTGMVQLSIRVADVRLANTNAKAPESQRTAAASIFDLLYSINEKLHGWTAGEGSDYGPLTRVSTRRIAREDGIREFEIIYSVQLFETSAEITYGMAPASPKIVVSIKKPTG
ncbi:MAG: hypothetical protein WCO44_12485 [Bacteroidota bacterium]